MKGCNCGSVPPCYGSLEFAIYEEAKRANDEWKKSRARHIKMIDKLRNKLMEGARTPDWAKNMLAGIPEQLSRAEYEILDEILKEKNRFMEEKKTKKMTKAEAFEWLKGKKVNTNGKGKEVQTKLFECGVSWPSKCFVYYDFGDYLLIETDGCLYHCGYEGDSYWRLHHFKEISADDILSIEIVDEKYELEFNYDKVVELAKPLMRYLNEVGFQDSIRVSRYGIVHEPMSTLIFDNGIGE